MRRCGRGGGLRGDAAIVLAEEPIALQQSKRWGNSTLSAHLREALGARPSLCSGSILGRLEALLALVERGMLPACDLANGAPPSDQAALNALVYVAELSAARVDYLEAAGAHDVRALAALAKPLFGDSPPLVPRPEEGWLCTPSPLRRRFASLPLSDEGWLLAPRAVTALEGPRLPLHLLAPRARACAPAGALSARAHVRQVARA